MAREKLETRRAREKARYESDPEYREAIKAKRRAYYEANKERVKERSRQHRATKPRSQWAANLRRYEGMDVETWEAMLIAQSGRCAICSDPMMSPHVDHCHETGVVRGLLCSECNHGLGKFKDSPARLLAAADYLASNMLELREP